MARHTESVWNKLLSLQWPVDLTSYQMSKVFVRKRAALQAGGLALADVWAQWWRSERGGERDGGRAGGLDGGRAGDGRAAGGHRGKLLTFRSTNTISL